MGSPFKRTGRRLTGFCNWKSSVGAMMLKTPMHLVHPEHGAAMVFDIYGMAVCPSCRSDLVSRSQGHGTAQRADAAKRAMPVRKPAKRVVRVKANQQ
jgi:hypothetical protein